MAAKRKASAMLHKDSSSSMMQHQHQQQPQQQQHQPHQQLLSHQQQLQPILPNIGSGGGASTSVAPEANADGQIPSTDDPYASLVKDADKLKLMLLAWNYQNSNAARTGTEAPDLAMVSGLWAQYQNALAMSAQPMSKLDTNSTLGNLGSASGLLLNTANNVASSPARTEPALNSPGCDNPDESSSSGHKDDDDGSEDDSEDRMDTNTPHDPERLKSFNMFVRLFVDENLDRMIPISKQPKEKIQAIIDSCTRQFPEFSERARKRIRTYLKSCRRNKKTRDGWETSSRPTPAHLTSVQAEQLLAIACENESMNAKRMRIGLDPISQTAPTPTIASASTIVGGGLLGVSSGESVANSISYPLGFNKCTGDESPANGANAITSAPKTNTFTSSMSDLKPLLATSLTSGNNGSSTMGHSSTGPDMYNPSADLSSMAYSAAAAAAAVARSQQYQQQFFGAASSASTAAASPPPSTSMQPLALATSAGLLSTSSATLTPTDLSMKPLVSTPLASLNATSSNSMAPSSTNPSGHQQRQTGSLLAHAMNVGEIAAVRQLLAGYRESAAFLLRSADELEQLVLNQQ